MLMLRMVVEVVLVLIMANNYTVQYSADVLGIIVMFIILMMIRYMC